MALMATTRPVRASARATATPKLTDLFPVKMTRCTTDEAWGTVTNRSDVAANVAVRIEWLSDSGLRLGDDTDWIFDLAPGQTAVWEVYNFTDFTPDRCDVELHDAYPS